MTQNPPTPGQAGADTDEIEVTPEMIEAGVYAAREHPLGGDLRDLVTGIYAIMRAVEDQSSVSASSTNEAK